jgi:DNA-binding phage protein
MHSTTHWKLALSLPFDTLCWLNVLTGDPFYVRYYAQDYEAFKERLTPEVVTALQRVKTMVKDEGQQIISALLCMYFSATDDQTLADMLKTVEDSDRMHQVIKQSQYYKEPEWQLYDAVRPELRTILRFLQDTGFDTYWQTSVLPQLELRIQHLQEELSQYNVVGEDEALLGFSLPSDEITIYVLQYAQPHGIKVLGMRFITDAGYPLGIVVRNAAHEMFHPPFDRQGPVLQICVNELARDSFFMDKFVHRDPSYGYNTLQSLIEEDCVRALEQLVNEKLDIAVAARERWRSEDDGLHVFAACLYAAMKAEHYNERGEVFEKFLERMVRTKLKPGMLEQAYTSFMQSS